MDSNQRAISTSQLVALLFASRLFTLLTWTPSGQTNSGAGAMISILAAAVGAFVITLPFLWLRKRTGRGLLEAARTIGAPADCLVSALLGGFCLLAAIHSISHYTFFMTSTIYPKTRLWIFSLCMAAAAGYGAWMGLEAFCRMGTFVALFGGVVLVLVSIILLPQLHLVNLGNPLAQNLSALGQGSLRSLLSYTDLIPFLLLEHRTEKPGGKPLFWWLCWSAFAFELMAAVTTMMLGGYGAAHPFPVHTLAVTARLGNIGRMDLLYLFLWTFTAFLRATMFLYAACVCLRRLWRKLSLGWSAFICCLAAGAASLAANEQEHLWHMAEPGILGTILFFFLIVGIPLLILPFSTKKEPKKEAAEKK